MTPKKITAQEGYIFVRKHDDYRLGPTLHLGYDFSTGTKREDKEDYYRQEPMTEEEKEIFQASEE